MLYIEEGEKKVEMERREEGRRVGVGEGEREGLAAKPLLDIR